MSFRSKGSLYSDKVEAYGWTHSQSADFLQFVVSRENEKGEMDGLAFHQFEPPQGYRLIGHSNAPEIKEGMVLMYFQADQSDPIELVVERHKF